MDEHPKPTREQTRRLWLSVMYEGPWERLADRLYAIDRRTGDIRRVIKRGGLREHAAEWCMWRDHDWRARYMTSDPPERWRRKPSRRADA